MPRPHFMPIQLRSGYYARNVGPLTLAEARDVCRVAQAAPAMLDALRYVLACVDRGDVSDMQPVRDAIAQATGKEI